MRVLLHSRKKDPVRVNNIYLLEDAFSIASPLVEKAVKQSISHLENFDGVTISSIRLGDIVGEKLDLTACHEKSLRNLQTAEFENTVGGWIETVKPELGPDFNAAYQNVHAFDRTGLNDALYRCESLFQKIFTFTKPGDLFCFPTTPVIAPKKGSLSSLDRVKDFYGRTMAVSSFSGVGQLPEISIPVAQVDGIPVGVSLAADYYQDEFLLDAAIYFFRLYHACSTAVTDKPHPGKKIRGSYLVGNCPGEVVIQIMEVSKCLYFLNN